MYADIHCHPGLSAYDRTRLADRGKDKMPSDPWQIPQSDLTKQSNGKRAFGYSQGDLAKSITAEAKLLFTALSPVEKGFFSGMGGKVGKKMVAEYYRRGHEAGMSVAIEWLLSQLNTQPGLEHLQKSSLDFLLSHPMNFSVERVRYMQEGHYDYFDELKREYKFYRSKMGQPCATTEELQLHQDGVKKKWCGTYYLAKCGRDMEKEFNPVRNELMMVLTIEGIHALGVGNPEDDALNAGDSRSDATIGKIKSRIRQLKGEELLEDADLPYWEHRPFFITFAHHFNNTLCGHARSFSNASRIILDQRKNMDKGVLRQGTYEVMQELLGLDENLKPTGSKRILIDIKHMSAASRSDFYKYLLRPFNYKSINKDRKIPVIASHVGYSGIDRLEVQIKNAQNYREEDQFKVNRFLGWSINLTDEDVIEVHHSRGLIGISFDQHVLGANTQSWWGNLPLKTMMRKRAMNLFERTIAQLVSIPFAYYMDEPLRIWDTLCVGTGFDGAITPVSRYATVLDFKTFEDDLVETLSRLKNEEPLWFGSHRPKQLARKICFENAVEFVKRNYE
jgi:hypothetical protein